jgi:alginate O-acetyltransferase complex protein AlgI
MLFNSIAFLFFFVCVLTAYRFAPAQFRKGLLLLVSYGFYAAWDWRFLPLIGFSTLLDFYVGKAIQKQVSISRRKWLLGISLAGNLMPLLFFKYYAFLAKNTALLIESLGGFYLPLPEWEIILPVGISFYTFQTLSYSIDIFKRKAKPTSSLADFALFVAFFPQLVAGPIEKARDLLPQLQQLPALQIQQLRYGLLTFSYGLISKVLIADSCGRWVNMVFAIESPNSASNALVGALLFAVQIYMDFAGYTLMAMGLARCFGIKLSSNFEQPYLSSNITEFWRRWHITLSSWLKEYVYIPLGGNRKGAFRQNINLMATMLIGGLWHGASWTFVVWGAIHGSLLIIHKLIFPTVSRLPKYLAWMGIPITFITVAFAWIFFRARDISQALAFIRTIVEGSISIEGHLWQTLAWCGGAMLVLDILQKYYGTHLFLRKWPLPVQYAIIICSWLAALLIMMPHKPQPFIYFQF